MKVTFFKIFGFLCLIIFFSCKETSDNHIQKFHSEDMITIQNNDVEFVLKDGIRNFRFLINGDYSITEQQPWLGTSSKQTKNTYQIRINAGRKKSEKVASWFCKNIENGNTSGCNTFALKPQKLNFAIKGTIYFEHEDEEYILQDVLIAQGNRAGSNNWWIGGKQMLRVDIEENFSFLIQELNSKVNPNKFIKLKIEPAIWQNRADIFYLSIIKG